MHLAINLVHKHFIFLIIWKKQFRVNRTWSKITNGRRQPLGYLQSVVQKLNPKQPEINPEPGATACKPNAPATDHASTAPNRRSIIAVITVEPADKIPFVYNCMQTRLRGQYNGKWPITLVCVSRPLVTVITAFHLCCYLVTMAIWPLATRLIPPFCASLLDKAASQ